jgi:YidC/Oxa1 family membrane protein insertase
VKWRGVGLYRDWKDSRRFRALAPEQRSIVFYAEDAASWTHLAPVVEELTLRREREVCYLTSSPTDPILVSARPGVRSFCIGAGTVRTSLFLGMEAGVVVMTVPDLEKYQLKRSRVHPVHYAYVFHSMVSTHMIYREEAFDHYDSVLCVGAHHFAEIRAAENARELEAKVLVEHGYGRLDALIAGWRANEERLPRAEGEPLRVLVAPSWGPDGLLETRGIELVQVLLAAGFHVTLRPHPMSEQKWPDAIRALRKQACEHPACEFEENVGSVASLLNSDVMISDWSGAALEYAFALERPVVWVDVPRKVNNPDYADLPHEPIEVSIRAELGVVVGPERLAEIPGKIEELCTAPEAFAAQIRNARDRTVYNVGASGRVGADHVAHLADAWLAREGA